MTSGGVDACTVAAFDAITAFAVPNRNRPFRSCRLFRICLLSRGQADRPALFGVADYVRQPSLSADLKISMTPGQIGVNAEGRCIPEMGIPELVCIRAFGLSSSVAVGLRNPMIESAFAGNFSGRQKLFQPG